MLAVVVGGDRVEHRGEAGRGLSFDGERRGQQLRDAGVVHRVDDPGDDAGAARVGAAPRVLAAAGQHLHHHVRIEVRGRGSQVLHDLLAPLGREHVDNREEMVIRGDNGGGLRGQHRRAVHRVVRSDDVPGQLADRADVLGDLQQARLCRGVGRRAPVEDAAHDRAPEVVLPPDRVRDLAVLQHAAEIDLLDRDRGIPFLRPDLGRAAALAQDP
jgi:hypothetical protein